VRNVSETEDTLNRKIAYKDDLADKSLSEDSVDDEPLTRQSKFGRSPLRNDVSTKNMSKHGKNDNEGSDGTTGKKNPKRLARAPELIKKGRTILTEAVLTELDHEVGVAQSQAFKNYYDSKTEMGKNNQSKISKVDSDVLGGKGRSQN